MSAKQTPLQFRTIAGRWKQHAEAGKLDKLMSRKEQGLAMLLFYAGFSAALEATIEATGFPEDQAMHLLQAMHQEASEMAAMATHHLGGGATQ